MELIHFRKGAHDRLHGFKAAVHCVTDGTAFGACSAGGADHARRCALITFWSLAVRLDPTEISEEIASSVPDRYSICMDDASEPDAEPLTSS